MRGINRYSQKAKFFLVVAVAAGLALSDFVGMSSAWAVKTIVQDPDEKWLAFEAEDFDHLLDLDNDGVTWQVIDDVDASGGKAIEADANVNFDTNEAEAVYNVKFTRPDYYRVFARYKNLGVSGNNDSFWTSGDPDAFPVQPLRTWFGPTPAGLGRSMGSDPSENTSGSPEYFYAFIGAASISFDANDAAQIDEDLEFRIGIREQGSILDRIVFADGSNPGPIDQTGGGRYDPGFQLDALTNSPIMLDGDPDLDADSDVDGADFLAIQRTDPSLIPAWQSQYGNGNVSGISAVPEPSSCLLLLAGGLMAAVRRKR